MKSPTRTILALMFFVAVLSTFDRVLNKEVPRPRIYIGAVVATVLLSLLSSFAPKVAVGLAVVSFIGTLVSVGPDTVRGVAPSDKFRPSQLTSNLINERN